METMTFRQLASEIVSIIEAGEYVPLFVHGAPGIGKSSLVKSIPQMLGESGETFEVIDLRMSLLGPGDLTGIPYPGEANDGRRRTEFLTPAWWPSKERGILFLDELNIARPGIAAAAYQLVLDRQVATHRLPDKWTVIAAGNRKEDSTLVQPMASPLANRFVHVELTVDYAEWRAWALGQGEHFIPIVAFLDQEEGNDLLGTPVSGPFPSPRSWGEVGKLMKIAQRSGRLPSLSLVVGAVGGVGAKFLEFLKVQKELPNFEAIEDGSLKPITISKDRKDLLYYILSVLEERFVKLGKGKANAEKKTNIFNWISASMPIEFVTLFVKRERNKEAGIKELPAFGKWAAQNAKYLLGKDE